MGLAGLHTMQAAAEVFKQVLETPVPEAAAA
jgi:hypothetical protein